MISRGRMVAIIRRRSLHVSGRCAVCSAFEQIVGEGLVQVVSGVIRWHEVMNESVGDVPCR